MWYSQLNQMSYKHSIWENWFRCWLLPFPFQMPASAPRKIAEDGTSTWAAVKCGGDPDGAPSSWLPSSTVLLIAAIWRVIQQMKACLPLLLTTTSLQKKYATFQINIFLNRIKKSYKPVGVLGLFSKGKHYLILADCSKAWSTPKQKEDSQWNC